MQRCYRCHQSQDQPAMLSHRPLTSLLLVATVCVNLVAATWVRPGPNGPSNAGQWMFAALYLSQVGMLSVWLALGTSAWRIRFLIWIAAVASSWGLAWINSDPVSLRTLELMLVAVYGGAVWMLMIGANLFLRSGEFPDQIDRAITARQFTLRHLFGWTTFTAVVAGAARYADSSIGLKFGMLLQVATWVAIPVVATVLLWMRRDVWARFASLLVVSAVLSYFAAVIVSDGGLPNPDVVLELAVFYLIQALVAGIWVIVVTQDTFLAQHRSQPPPPP